MVKAISNLSHTLFSLRKTRDLLKNDSARTAQEQVIQAMEAQAEQLAKDKAALLPATARITAAKNKVKQFEVLEAKADSQRI